MIDWRMLPLLGLLYSVALIDRINLGIARTAGMQEDLVRPKPWVKRADSQVYDPPVPSEPRRRKSLQHRLNDIFLPLHAFVRYPFFIPIANRHWHHLSRQIPGNLILRSIGPRNLLTVCVVGWGIAQLGMAFVKTWGFLCLCRVFLGAFEVRKAEKILLYDNADSSFLMLNSLSFSHLSCSSLQLGISAMRSNKDWLYSIWALSRYQASALL